MENKFNRLTGRNEFEYQKNLGKYISALKSIPTNEVNNIIDKIVPGNLQEDLSYVKILLIFKRFDKLMDVIYTTNWILTKVIIKNDAFLSYITSIQDTFVSEICPKISYNCRFGILSKLAKYLINGNELFIQIRNVYGTKLAKLLLPTCSEKLIKANFCKFTDRELIKIYNRFGLRMLTWYFNQDDKLKPGNPLIKHIIEVRDGNALANFVRRFDLKLGKKGFILLLKSNVSEIINNPFKYQQWKKVIYRLLKSTDWESYFRNLFPRNRSTVNSCFVIHDNLELLPSSERFNTVTLVFLELYNQNLDVEKDATLVALFSLEDRRLFCKREDQVFGESKFASHIVYQLMHTIKNVPSRVNLMGTFIQNCKMNDDYETILLTLRNACMHSMEYNFPVRERILNSIRKSFNISRLSSLHWECIHNLLKLCDDRNEIYFDRIYYIEAELIATVKSGKTNKKLLNSYIVDSGCYRLWGLGRICYSLQRKIALMVGHLITTDYVTEKKLVVDFLSFIQDYNRKHKKTRISYFMYPELVQVLMTEFSLLRNSYFSSILESVLCYKAANSDEAKLQKSLWQKYLGYATDESLVHSVHVNILMHNPDLIIEFADKIDKKDCIGTRFYYQCAKMHYTKVQKYFNHLCIKAYSNSYIQEAESYPNQAPANPIDSNVVDLSYKRLYLQSLKATPIPYLDIAKKYCRLEDKNDTSGILRNLLRKMVLDRVDVHSVPIFCTVYIADLKSARNIIDHVGFNYEQRIKTMMNCFVNDASDEFMELLSTIVKLYKGTDYTAIVKTLHQFHKVPRDRMLEYSDFLWSHKDTKTINVVSHLSVPKMLELKRSVMHNVFVEVFNCTPTEESVAFICAYLLRDFNFNFFFQCLEKSKWTPNDCTQFMLLLVKVILKYKNRESMESFTTSALELQDYELPKNISTIYTHLLELVNNTVGFNPDEFLAHKSLKLLKDYVNFKEQSHFGYEVIHYYAKYVHMYFEIANLSTVRLEIIDSLLKLKDCLATKLMSLAILPKTVNPHDYTKFISGFIQQLESDENMLIQMLIKRYVNDFEIA